VIRRAVLYLATPDDARGGLLEIAGRPVAFRALMALVRVGFATVGVPAAFRGTPVERAVAASAAARAAVVWLPGGTLPPEPALLVPATALLSLLTLVEMSASLGLAVLAATRDADGPVVAADAALVEALREPLERGAPLGGRLAAELGRRDAGATHAAPWHARASRARRTHAAPRHGSGSGWPAPSTRGSTGSCTGACRGP
jgi:hypothetical protein